jgi:hypothetical protein
MVVGWLAISVSAFAADSTYIGAGIFVGNVDYADKKVGMFDDIRPFGGVVRLGTYLIPAVALELRYMDASGEESASDGEGGSKADFDLHVISGLIKFDIPKTGKAQLYGLLGWSSVHLEVLNVSERQSGVSYGFGMEVNMTEHTLLSAEYNHLVNGELLDVAGFNILATIKF